MTEAGIIELELCDCGAVHGKGFPCRTCSAESDAKRLAEAAVTAAYRLHAKHMYFGGPVDWRVCASAGCQQVASALGLPGYRPKDDSDLVTRADLKYALRTNDLPKRVVAREALRLHAGD